MDLYLKRHSYANATAADFWNAETHASGKPIDKIMPTWIEQAGLPLIVVKAKCLDDVEKVALEQERYFYDRAKLNAGSPELWQIPICMKASGMAVQNKGRCELLAKKQVSFTLKGCSPWVYANANAQGTYRSSYNPDAVESMAKVAKSALTPAERLMLLDDVWASVAVDREPIGDYMVFAEGLRTERSAAVLEEVLKRLTYIHNYLVSGADRESYELWVRRLFTPMAQDVGWEAKARRIGRPGQVARGPDDRPGRRCPRSPSTGARSEAGEPVSRGS